MEAIGFRVAVAKIPVVEMKKMTKQYAASR